MILNEITRKNLVGKSKSQSPDRYNRRLGYSPKSYKGIDISRLFDDDILIIKVPVGDYTCTVAFKGMLQHLKDVVDKQPKPTVTLQTVIKAMNVAIDDTDLLVDCTCPDFCLHEDTQIKLLNGEIYSIKDIKSKFDNNEELWVYSVDENGDFKPGKVTDVWISGYVNQMIKITLDNGKEIITTPNHRYMLRDGSYEEAKDLSVDQSLMPLYFNYHNGYESVKINSKNNVWRSVYKLVSGELLSEQIKEAKARSEEDIIQIHHSDFNKLNNYPSNLKPMGKIEHWYYHAKLATEDEERFEKFIKAGRDYWDSEEGRLRKSKEMSESIKKFWKSLSNEEREEYIRKSHEWMHTEEGHKKLSDGLKRYWSNLSEKEFNQRCIKNGITLNGENGELASQRIKDYWELLDDESKERRFKNLRKIAIIGASKPKSKHMKQSISESMKQKYLQMTEDERKHYTEHLNNPETQRKSKIGRYRYALDYIIKNGLSLNPENYYKYKRKSDPKIETYFNSFNELIEHFGLQYYNHRISSIELINYENPIPVYDLTVDKWNNFYVDSGVILHNCYRFAYWATKYGYKYGKPETRPSKITNPDDKLGAMCKHLSALLSNKKWITKMASTLNSFIKENIDKIREFLGVSEDELTAAKPSKIPKGSKFNKSTGRYELPYQKSDDTTDNDQNKDSDAKDIEFSNEPDEDDDKKKNFKNTGFKSKSNDEDEEDSDDNDEELELKDEEDK